MANDTFGKQAFELDITELNLLCTDPTSSNMAEIITQSLSSLRFTQKVTIKGESYQTVDSNPSSTYTNIKNIINAFADTNNKQGSEIINVLCTLVRDYLRDGPSELVYSISKIMIKRTIADLMSNNGM